MAAKKTPQKEVPKLQTSSIGYNGLSVTSGLVLEECDPALRWPQCQYTYKKMLKDSTVGISVEAVQTDMSRPKWDIVAPKGYEKELEEDVKILRSMMFSSDMYHSFLSFIKQATSHVPFGFAAFEIIPRKRLKSKGSNYNDGYWGIGKLALRSQDTISAAEFSSDGDFAGFWQRVNRITNKANFKTRKVQAGKFTNEEVLIPAEKLLLFRNNPLKDNPYGSSPLNYAFEAWKYKKAYEEAESHGVVQDVHGLKVLYIPPEYLSPDAEPENKAVFAEYQRIMRNLHIGRESGIILPQMLDGNGEQYFKFEVVSVTGSKAYDVNAIISRYKNEIITALYATSLVAGQEGGGSFALSESLIEIKDKVIETKLEEIRDVLNHKLIPLIYKWNGWETEVYPQFVFQKVNVTAGVDIASKGLQRAGAVKLIARTPKNINAIAEMLNLPDRVDEDMSQDALEKILGTPPEETKAGQGQAQGLNSGTGKATGKSGDSSTSNSSNS